MALTIHIDLAYEYTLGNDIFKLNRQKLSSLVFEPDHHHSKPLTGDKERSNNSCRRQLSTIRLGATAFKLILKQRQRLEAVISKE